MIPVDVESESNEAEAEGPEGGIGEIAAAASAGEREGSREGGEGEL
jgi:hypothetical protein